MTVHRYPHVVQAVFGRPWAILPEKLDAIAEVIRARIEAGFALPEFEAAASRSPGPTVKGIAVVPLYGTLMWRVGAMEAASGATSVQQFARTLQSAVEDPTVGRIVIDVDSPGGQTDGITETAALIREARARKPITAVANTMMASAAYALGSQATDVVASPSAMVGSIGVYAVHLDTSAQNEMVGVRPTYISAPEGGYKTEFASDSPLSDESRARLQAIVTEAYNVFVADVAKGRAMSEETVRDASGKGRIFTASEAKRRGLVDRVESLDQVIARLTRASNGSRNRAERERALLGA